MSEVQLDHVGIAVDDLDAALRFYTGVLGLPPGEIETREDIGLRIARIRVAGVTLELVEARDWTRTTQRYQERRGPGAYHVGLRTTDVDRALSQLAADGVPLIDDRARDGVSMRAGFAHPSAGGGVLVELVTHREPRRS